MVTARTTTLQVDGLLRSSSRSRVRSALERRPGVLSRGRGGRGHAAAASRQAGGDGWAIGYDATALPTAAGVSEPPFGLALRPEIAALSMSGSSFSVAVNALLLQRLRLPA